MDSFLTTDGSDTPGRSSGLRIIRSLRLGGLLMALVLSACSSQKPATQRIDLTPPEILKHQGRFEALNRGPWEIVMHDPGTGPWSDYWTLDGLKATVSNNAEGMTFAAGPVPFEDASHAVLWTHQTFSGDLRIEYEYTRLDDATRFVNIIYLHATGRGEPPYTTDLAEWAQLRTVPAMRIYFNHAHTYHISYAAYENDDNENKVDYVRARRYRPDLGGGLPGTELEPDDYADTGFFETGVPHRITVIKAGAELYMHVANPTHERLFAWDTSTHPDLDEGRIGLRHMFTRQARYRDFSVSVR